MSTTVNIRLIHDTGSLMAYADIQVHFAASVLSIHGVRVVQHDPEKPPWIAYPQQPGKKEGKWYDVVKATGKLHEEISSAVLTAYADAQVKAESAPAAATKCVVPKAQIPTDEIPF